MNVLFVANCATMYGANTSMLQLIKQLKKDNFNVYVWLPKNGPIIKELRKLKCTYKIIGNYIAAHEINDISRKERVNNLFKNILWIKRNVWLVKDWDIDIIHTNSAVDYIGGLLSLYTGVPHVWHIREMMQDDYGLEYDLPKLSYYLLKRAHKVIFISKATENKWKNAGLYKNSCVIYDGFDIEHYIIYKDLEKKKITKVVLAGFISPQKGQIDAVKAIRYLINKKVKNIRLSIVGDGDKAYIKKIEKYIEQHNLGAYIEILPFQKDLKAIRRESDIALMCSRKEALGRVTIESMAGQLLVIGTNSGGTKELIEDGRTGYLYEAGSWRQLAEKITTAVNDWDTSQKIITLAQKEVINKFAIDKYAHQIEKIYGELIGKSKYGGSCKVIV